MKDPLGDRDYWLQDGFSWSTSKTFDPRVRALIVRRVSRDVTLSECASDQTEVSPATWIRVEDGYAVPTQRMVDVMNRQLDEAIAIRWATSVTMEAM